VTISVKTVAQRVKQVSGVTFISVQVMESMTIYIDIRQYNKLKLRSKSIRKSD